MVLATLTAAQIQLDEAIDLVERVLGDVEPSAVSGDEALSLVDTLARGERAISSGMARLTPRVIETGSFTKTGHASAPDWLSSIAGTSAGAAKSRLAAAERAAGLPVLVEALRDGELSASELSLVTKAAATGPAAVETLLSMKADGASHQELADEATRLRAAARSRECEREQRQRVHRMRHFRWHQVPEGGIRSEFFCDEVAWAKVAPDLEAKAKKAWLEAGADREALEAYRLDVFLECLADGGGGSGRGAQPHVVVLVDAEALERGVNETGEICEIDGIGPISVDAAREMLGDGVVQFVARSGVDIRTVTGTSRAMAQRLAMALLVRDRVCCVPGCGKHRGLEDDHCEIDFAKGGRTELANLARLCGPHHDMKTYGGWRLTGGPARWKWEPPPSPPTAGRIGRARRMAVAKANRIRD
ncbi:MAG TPA: HNH endonuclease signature motif containing protein [Acidimicrobiales bacterium]|nr:HNH endonuclease signature motif containing protein [Acidimicrobiales bacterium]